MIFLIIIFSFTIIAGSASAVSGILTLILTQRTKPLILIAFDNPQQAAEARRELDIAIITKHYYIIGYIDYHAEEKIRVFNSSLNQLDLQQVKQHITQTLSKNANTEG